MGGFILHWEEAVNSTGLNQNQLFFKSLILTWHQSYTNLLPLIHFCVWVIHVSLAGKGNRDFPCYIHFLHSDITGVKETSSEFIFLVYLFGKVQPFVALNTFSLALNLFFSKKIGIVFAVMKLQDFLKVDVFVVVNVMWIYKQNHQTDTRKFYQYFLSRMLNPFTPSEVIPGTNRISSSSIHKWTPWKIESPKVALLGNFRD